MRLDGGSYLVKRAIARSLRVSEISYSGSTTQTHSVDLRVLEYEKVGCVESVEWQEITRGTNTVEMHLN